MEGLHPRLVGGAIKDWSHDTDQLLVRFTDNTGNVLVGRVTFLDLEEHLAGGKEIVLTVEEIPD